MAKRCTALSSKHKRAFRVLKNIESDISSGQAKYNVLLADHAPEFDSLGFNKKYLYLKKENKELREELKHFNSIITVLLESRSASISPS